MPWVRWRAQYGCPQQEEPARFEPGSLPAVLPGSLSAGWHSCFATETGTMAFLASGGASDSCHQQCGGHSCLATETGTMAFLDREFASDSSWTSPFPCFRRSAFSSGQSSRLLTGARAESYDQIVDLPTLQIQERVSERVVEQIVDLAVPQTCALPRVWLVLAQLDVLRNWKETEAYKNEVYLLPTELV